jgi:hypothetical protein
MNSTPDNQKNPENPGKKTNPKVVYFLFFLAFLVIGVIALFMTSLFLLNNFREPIATGLSRASGLKINFDSIGLSFTHGLGLRCSGVTVHSAHGKKSLFSADKFIIEIETLPLLHKQIIIKSSTLVNPVFPFPFESSTIPVEPTISDEPQPEASPPLPPSKRVSKQTPTEKVRIFLKKTDLTLNDIAIENGKILLSRSQNPSAQPGNSDLSFSLKLKILRPNPDRIDLSLTSIALDMKPFKLKGEIFINDLMSPGAVLQANFKPENFTDSDIYHIREFLPDHVQQVLDQKIYSGKFQDISLKADFPIEPAGNYEAIRRHANALMTFNVEEGTLLHDKQVLAIPHAEFNLKWENNLLTHNVKGFALDGEFSLIGNMPPDSDNTLDTDLELSNINLSKARLSGEWEPRAGVVSGKIHLSVPKDNRLVWQGQLNAKKLALGVPENRRTVENASVKLQTQPDYRSNFDVKLNGVVLGQTKFKQALGVVDVSKESIQLSHGRIFPEHGQIDLNGNYYPLTQKYDLRFAGKKLASEDLLPEYIEGPLDLEGNLVRGKHAKHPLRGVSGSMQIKFADGSLRQLGFFTTLLTLLNPQSLATAQKQGLNFSYLGGNFIINDGVITTADMELKGPQMNLLAAGKADLATDNLKGEIKAMPLQLVDSVVKIIPLLGKILANKGGVVETYFEVEGTFSNPKFRFLPGKSIIGKPVRVLEELIKLPGSLVENKGETIQEPIRENEGQQKKTG